MRTPPFLLVLSSALVLSACASLTPNRQASDADQAAVDASTAPKVLDVTPVQAMPQPDATVAEEKPDDAPPEDLWARIRGGFGMDMPENSRIDAELAFFSARPGYMERVSDRAEPYLYYIVDEIERRGLPMELALLPIVESAYQPFAYSPGRAAGIWQFIPSTGLHFGLKQTWWYDGRRDIIASTDAALTYLESLYNQFGDWEHALAAYNAGQGTVRSAIRRNGNAGRPTDYWNLPLPRETQGYVPRLLALRALIETPEEYGLTLRPLANEPYLAIIDIDSQIDLALAAELADLTIKEVYRLNPGFNRWATDPDGPHRLVLPLDRADAFTAGLEALPASERVTWRRHQVRSGQTLSHIAREHNTTVTVIQEANGLRDHRIRAGAHLIVPVSRGNAEEYTLSASQRLNRLQATNREGQRHTHTVRNGDTLWDISRRYGVSVGQVTNWNGMAPNDILRPGQDLVIWLPEGQVRTASQANSRAPIPSQQNVQYTVRRGDSLYRIARQFNVSVADLRRWNNLPSQGYLQPGQRLRVMVDVTSQQSDAI
ncbi:hypothetical protein CAI21_02420 [Alkalilimnicola ehrlichii]|uniref:lytic transglycosylase n=1 Tax=Alkalilimnicola ehrlichii TaxID=351052 RepID=UPI000E2EF532|nr:LysM peptidoglycan-binding domain-containing protein [Alkalilimnicola ehrlichii]RFA30860.1 hypothetical protein CAI21_02420 [Alkalilimnicola ehrlichii]